MKAELSQRRLIVFFNWASIFVQGRGNGQDSPFRKSVQMNFKEIEPLVFKCEDEKALSEREFATLNEDGSIKKVPTGRKVASGELDNEKKPILIDELETHYTKDNYNKMMDARNKILERKVRLDVYPLSKETSIPESFRNSFPVMRAISGIVVTEKMAEDIMYKFDEEEEPKKQEKKEEKKDNKNKGKGEPEPPTQETTSGN